VATEINFDLPDELLALQTRAREYVAEQIAPSAGERDRAERFERGIVDGLGKAGFGRMAFEGVAPGQTPKLLPFAIVCEEIARHSASDVLNYGSHAMLAAGTIHRYGTPEQIERYFGPLIDGELLGCYSITEPGAGSDAAALQTVAVRDGDEYRLTGTKIFATNGPDADIFVIFAKTDPEAGGRGVSAFIVERGFPGITTKPMGSKLGMRASAQAVITLDDCRVPASNLLGEEGAGLRIALGSLDVGRVAIAAQGVGIARGAYEEARAHALERQAFGRPIAENQGVGFLLADMWTETDAARLLTWRAAGSVSAGRRASHEVAMAKGYATDVAMRAAENAVQILGGKGCTTASPVERYFRDAKVAQIYDGTNQVMRMVIVGQLSRT